MKFEFLIILMIQLIYIITPFRMFSHFWKYSLVCSLINSCSWRIGPWCVVRMVRTVLFFLLYKHLMWNLPLKILSVQCRINFRCNVVQQISIIYPPFIMDAVYLLNTNFQQMSAWVQLQMASFGEVSILLEITRRQRIWIDKKHNSLTWKLTFPYVK